MSELIAAGLMVGGTVFMFVAAIGLLRLPDLYTRMHAVTKAGTLGVGLLLLSAAVAFESVSVTAQALTALLFVLLTAPVSAHMIGRAGYLGDAALWEHTVFDHWEGEHEMLRREGEEVPNQADVQASNANDPPASAT